MARSSRQIRDSMLKKSLLIGVVAMVGCATPAERAARVQAEVEDMIQVYGPACEKLGYRRDDDKWRDCVIRLAAKAEQRLSSHPTTTSCFGHRGFFNCTTF